MFVELHREPERIAQESFAPIFPDLIKPEYREELRNAESGDLYKRTHSQAG